MKKTLLFLLLITVMSYGQEATGTYKTGKLQLNVPEKTSDTLTQVVVRDSTTKMTKVMSRKDFLKGLKKGTVTNISATNGTGKIFTITNPTTTPNLSLELTKDAVGLSNVDNTSDINKPISTATQTALNGKQSILTNPVTGTGTVNRISKWTGNNSQGISNITDNGTTISTSTDMTVNGVLIGRGSGNVSSNTVNGFDSFGLNTTGISNISIGFQSLKSNTSGSNNSANGSGSLYSNTSGSNNTANGISSLYNNSLGNDNTAIGGYSLSSNRNSNQNIGVGYYAGTYLGDKTTAATALSNSIFIGYRTSPLANDQSNQVVIGNDAIGLGSNTTVIGSNATLVSAIRGRALFGTLTDNTVDRVQVNGSLRASSLLISDTPTTSTTTYDMLTRNSISKKIEQISSSTFQTALGYTSENIANKSDSYTTSSSSTYASTKALVDGLATKQSILTNPVTGTGTVNYLQKVTSAGVLGNSLINEISGRVLIEATDNGVDKLQVNGNITSAGYKIPSGLSTQFLKADGSVDSNTYVSSSILSDYVPYTGATQDLDLGIRDVYAKKYHFGDYSLYSNISGIHFEDIDGHDAFKVGGPSITVGELTAYHDSGTISFNLLTNTRNYLMPDASGTVALTSDLPFNYLNEGNGNGVVYGNQSRTFYGNIGLDAIDFSYSDTVSNTFGATGESSFAAGIDNISSGYGSTTFGYKNTNASVEGFMGSVNSQSAGNVNSILGVGHNVTGTNITVVGQASNIISESTATNNASTSPVFVVGNGTITDADPDYAVATRSDALIVRKNGVIEAPSQSVAEVNAGTAYTVATKEWVQTQTRPYKVYTATFSQSGISAPTVTVLENTLGGMVTWTRTGTGVYIGTLTGAFTIDKCAFFYTNSDDRRSTSCGYNNINSFFVMQYEISSSGVPSYIYPADGVYKSTVEVRVYN